MSSAWLGLLAVAAAVLAQAPGERPRPAAAPVLGEVTALDAAGSRLTVKTDAGESLVVVSDERTSFLRVKPGAASLTDATPAAFADIGVGDRVLVRGARSADGSSLAARQVVQMTRSDIAQKQERERAEWRRRGVVGVVSALDPQKREIALTLRSPAGAETLAIAAPEGKAAFRRYAPDSVKFSDARPSSFEELRVGDQLRALGDRSPDGARLEAEQVVSGAFRSVTGTVESVDAAKGLLVLRDLGSDKRVTVLVGPDTMLRRLPTRAGGPEPGPGAEAGRGAGGRRGGLGDMLERLPPTSLAEIAPGAAVAVSSTEGPDPSRMNAIALLSGLEALATPRRGRRGGQDTELGLPQGILDISIGLP